MRCASVLQPFIFRYLMAPKHHRFLIYPLSYFAGHNDLYDEEKRIDRVKEEPLRVFLPHIEQALHAEKDQGEHAHADAGPPRTQGTVELQDRDDGTVN